MAVEGFDLGGKRALVVGAESPIGRSIGVALEEAGARVALVAEPEMSVGSAERLVEDAVGRLDGLDVLVSAGDLRAAGPFAELTDGDWDRLVGSNLTTPVRLIRAAGRLMLEQGGGRIICVVSMLGERGVPHTAAYGACQAALIQLIRALALEWARHNVRINGIGLGWFEGDPLLEGHQEQLLKYLPMRRFGKAEEVGALAVYLASDAADLMTGQTIFVDGAIMAHA